MKDERNWYTDPPKTKKEWVEVEQQDRNDLVAVAHRYTSTIRCKLCGHLRVQAYICWNCHGDDTL